MAKKIAVVKNEISNNEISKPEKKVSDFDTSKKIKQGNSNLSEDEIKALFDSSDFDKEGKKIEYSVMKKNEWLDLVDQEVKIIFLGDTGTFENEDGTKTRYIQFHSDHESKNGKVYSCALSAFASPIRNGGKGKYKVVCKGEIYSKGDNLMVDFDVKQVAKF